MSSLAVRGADARLRLRQRLRLLLGWVGLAVIPLAAAAALRLERPGREATLLLAIAVASLLPLLYRCATQSLDSFEPLVPATAAFVLLFVARPTFDHARNTRSFAGVDVGPTYPTMLVVVLIGVVLFQIGYAFGRRRRTNARIPSPRDADTGMLLLVAGALTLASLGLLVLRALLAGGVSTLILNRSQFDARAINVPFVSESVMLALPALLVLWAIRGPHRVTARILSIVPLGVLLASALPQGNRRDLLPLIVGAVALLYLRRDTRPALTRLTLVAALVFLVVVTPLRASRNGGTGYGANLVTAAQHPMRSVEGLFTEEDTAMTNALAIEVRDVGARIPWQRGRSVLAESVLQPVPRQLWEAKPEPIRTQLIELNWGLRNGVCFTQCPTFSVLGSLYADAGLWTVGAGCLLIGILLARWYDYFSRRRRDPLVQAAYAATLFLPFYVWWSSLGVLLLDLVLFAAPLMLAARVARLRRSA
jgi:hypothetical protein